ncbi:Ig-like domain-containing protein [Candidatus Nitrospira nitrificans]|uniref:Uncharacterized protein n=1 Tax=Candidatus Nitrospira nitrificans TaxID=1742973 RepID=A0A0S4L5E6_9BACT|nr:Ig-like domain-containing protein [Candidatus Nitrospira nitrificans]CUS32415.1 conserved exported hypothetical protein [Candidatus Nitrospira nitrificans]
MRRVGAVLAAVGLLTLSVGVNVWAAGDDGSQVKITSPAAGAVLKGGDVEVKYELTKGSQATHVHCFVDGEYQKGWKGMVKGMSPGAHEIKVVAADKDHQTLAAESAVKVEVQ